MKTTVNKFGTVNEVIEQYPEIDYVLIWRHNSEGWQEFVAAWHFDEETGTWGQGHYFNSARSAVNYINSKYPNATYTRAQRLLDWTYDYLASAMNDVYEVEDRKEFIRLHNDLMVMHELLDKQEEWAEEDKYNEEEAE